jgi:ribosomal protein S13
VKWVISGHPLEDPETQGDIPVISTMPGEYVPVLPLLATQGVVFVVVMATGLEKPEKIGQLEEEQITEVELEAVEEEISVTAPEVTSLVTQTLPEPSTTIPVGELKPEKVGQLEEEQVTEVELEAVEERIFVTDP